MPGLAASNPALQKLVFALVFPMGLLMVILSGAQLYTGNTAVVTCALCEGKVRARIPMVNGCDEIQYSTHIYSSAISYHPRFDHTNMN